MTIAAAAVLIVLGLWAAVTFNRLIRGRYLVGEAWSGIDVQLKRRHDLIPAIVEAVKGYRDHERKLLGDVTEARAGSAGARGVKERGEAENVLSRSIRSLFAVAEAYPALKASVGFLDLQKSLSDVEDSIQLARRYYNGTVRNYNIRVESFPGNLVAGLFRFRPADFFEIEYATERKTPEIMI